MYYFLRNEPLILIHTEIDKLRFQFNIITQIRDCKGVNIIFIHENLKFLRNKYNLTLLEMAFKVKIPLRTLEDIFYGKRTNPRIDTIIKIAIGFNLTLDEFVLKDLSK